LGAAYMRLKFLLEACDPQHIAKKITPKMKTPLSPFQQQPANEIWKYEDYTDYIAMDNLCNCIFETIVKTIKSVGQNTKSKEPHALVKAAITLNTTLPTIRENKCGIFNWSNSAPQDLVAYPYFMFVIQCYSIVNPLLAYLASADPIPQSS